MNELNKLYKSMLMSWGALIKEDSRIVFTISGSKEEIPIRIDEQDLYLPTSEVLEANCIGKVFFHPACENITSKETEVFKIIRRMTAMRLLDAFRRYPAALIAAAGTVKKAWRQDTLDMMEPLKSVKRGTLNELNGMFQNMEVEVGENGIDNRFIHIKVTKGGGRSHRTNERVYYKAKPSFPFYDEIVKRLVRSEGSPDNQQIELNGNSYSRAALKLAQHLFQSIIPAVLEPGAYEFEATQSIGARMCAYLGCYGDIAEQMNRVQNMHRAEFDKMGIHPIDLNWLEHMEDLPDIYRQVPALEYNSHNTYEEGVDAPNTNRMSNMMSVSSSGNNQQQQQQPQQTQQQNNPMMTVAQQQGFDTTVPQLQPGDKWVRTDIDIANNQVIHHAVNMAGMPVVYLCTRYGNILQRNEGAGMMGNMMGGMGMMQPNMMQPNMMGNMMMPGNMMMMPNMMPNMMMNGMMMPSAVTASGAGGGYNIANHESTAPATY